MTIANKTSFVPLAPVHLVKPTGQVRGFGLGAASDAARGDAIIQAQTAAVSGDTILVFADADVSGSLGKDGVDWWFAPTTIRRTDSDSALWDDGGASADFIVTGYARFVHTGYSGTAIRIANANSDQEFYCRSVETTFAESGGATAVFADAGRLKVFASEYVKSRVANALTNSGAELLEVHTDYISGGESAVAVSDGVETRVYAKRIEGDAASTPGNNGTLTIVGGQTTYIAAEQIIELLNYYPVIYAIGEHSTRIDCPKIVGFVQATDAVLQITSATIDSTSEESPTILLEDADLTLKDVCLVTKNTEAYSISGQGETISVVGGLSINKPVDEVTLNYLSKVGDSTKLAGVTPTSAGLALLDDANAAAQRSTLGLGTMAVQAANSVAITGGSVTGITDLALTDGGTGASTAADARTNLGLGTSSTPTFASVSVNDDVYAPSWNGSTNVPTKNAVFDKLETVPPAAIGVAVSDESTALTTGTAKVTFRMPYAMTLTEVRASLNTASSSGTPTIDINEGGASILSTPITIDANERTSLTAATPPAINDASLADDAEITVDIDVAGSGAKGLKVWLIGRKT